jgi:NifU-like protein involved in Fe-S cluster formation
LRPARISEGRMTYNELTRRHFEAPRNAGELPGSNRAAAGSRSQGTWVQFDLELSAGAVSAARFLAFGCPHVIAACDIVCEEAEGGRLEEVRLRQGARALLQRLGAPIEKLGRLLVVEDAWLAAVRAASGDRGH